MINLNKLKTSDEFKDFTWLFTPQPFSTLFKDKNYSVVQIFDEESESGLVGSFSWVNNKLEPLDGDSYNSDMIIYGYKKFHVENNLFSIDVLDVIVDNW